MRNHPPKIRRGKSILPLLLVFASSSLQSALACSVHTLDGNDLSSSLVSNGVVVCDSVNACSNNIIDNCDVVKCTEASACVSASIVNLSTLLECSAHKACDNVKLYDSSADVDCTSTMACVSSSIQTEGFLTCSGAQSCSNSQLQASQITCTEGAAEVGGCQESSNSGGGNGTSGGAGGADSDSSSNSRCLVLNPSNVDVTDDYVQSGSSSTVVCDACRNFRITGCNTVQCTDCKDASISNFDSVTCNHSSACANVDFVDGSQVNCSHEYACKSATFSDTKFVSCQGAHSCASSIIDETVDTVACVANACALAAELSAKNVLKSSVEVGEVGTGTGGTPTATPPIITPPPAVMEDIEEEESASNTYTAPDEATPVFSPSIEVIPDLSPCSVTVNGDMVPELIETIDGKPTVNCHGTACQGARIKNCPKIECVGEGACLGAQVLGLVELICSGDSSCYETKVYTQAVEDGGTITSLPSTITCDGPQSCASSEFAALSNHIQVECYGTKACDKTVINAGRSGKVFCDAPQACPFSTTITSGQVYCSDDSEACSSDLLQNSEPIPDSINPCDSFGLCQVNKNGQDVTADFVELHPGTCETVVNCNGGTHCQLASVSNCDKVECIGEGACVDLQAHGVSAVICKGATSCYEASITGRDVEDFGVAAIGSDTTILCDGSEACASATMTAGSAASLNVECYGDHGCASTSITANVDGNIVCVGEQSCPDSANIISGTLACGAGACASKFVQDESTETSECTPGDCRVDVNGDNHVLDLVEYVDGCKPVVNCHGTACQTSSIAHCPSVECVGEGACLGATMMDVDEIICKGDYSCSESHISGNGDPDNPSTASFVICDGVNSCEESVITVPTGSFNVQCYGSDACAKASLDVGSFGSVICDLPNKSSTASCVGDSTSILSGSVSCEPGACSGDIVSTEGGSAVGGGMCSVKTSDGKTASSMIESNSDGSTTVNCDESCQGATITDCDEINCFGQLSCSSARISGFTILSCTGEQSCRGSSISNGATVICESKSSCEDATVDSPDVTCYGKDACHNSSINAGSGTVLCSQDGACTAGTKITASNVKCKSDGCTSGFSYTKSDGSKGSTSGSSSEPNTLYIIVGVVAGIIILYLVYKRYCQGGKEEVVEDVPLVRDSRKNLGLMT